MRTKAKPSITTPNTLLVGVYIDSNVAAITVAHRTTTGELCNDVHTDTGEPYVTLARTLMKLRYVEAENLVMLTNDADLHRRLRSPFRYDNYDPKKWPDAYWRILYECTEYCLRGRWNMLQVDTLPGARQLWLQHQQQPNEIA